MSAESKQLAEAFLDYSEAIARGQADPESMTSVRTMAGDDLDTSFEKMHRLACQVLGRDPDLEMARIQELGWGGGEPEPETVRVYFADIGEVRQVAVQAWEAWGEPMSQVPAKRAVVEIEGYDLVQVLAHDYEFHAFPAALVAP